MPASPTGEPHAGRGARRRAGLQGVLSRDRAAAQHLDQLARPADRLGRRQGWVVQSEPAEPSVEVRPQELRRLVHRRHHADHRPAFGRQCVHDRPRLPVVLGKHHARPNQDRHLRRIATDVRAVLLEDAFLPLQILELPAEPVTDVSVLGEDAESAPLAAAADEDLRPALLDRSRHVERAVDSEEPPLERGALLREHEPGDLYRLFQPVHAPTNRGNSNPYPACSSLFQAAPMPRIARPFETTSSVVTIFARSAGLRYVTPVTSVPSFTLVVRTAMAP